MRQDFSANKNRKQNKEDLRHGAECKGTGSSEGGISEGERVRVRGLVNPIEGPGGLGRFNLGAVAVEGPDVEGRIKDGPLFLPGFDFGPHLVALPELLHAAVDLRLRSGLWVFAGLPDMDVPDGFSEQA